MVALYILLGLALLICAVLFFPFTVVLEYSETNLNVYQKILFFKIPFNETTFKKLGSSVRHGNGLLKGKRKAEDEKKKKAKKSFDEIMEIISLVRLLLAKFFGYLRIRVARFNIKVATGDPATTAIAYGAVNSAMASVYPFLESSDNVKGLERAEINVCCDFFSNTPDADIKLAFTLRVWQALSIVLSAAIRHAKNMIEKDKKKANKANKKININS